MRQDRDRTTGRGMKKAGSLKAPGPNPHVIGGPFGPSRTVGKTVDVFSVDS